MSDASLADLARRYGTDKLSHNYCDAYEKHLGHLRDVPIALLEIGIFRGYSLRMWADYFNRAAVVGVDIVERCPVVGDRIETVIADIKDYVPDREFDVIVDDGSHMADDIIAAHARLWPRLRPGGWYVIEDWRTQWEAFFGGGPQGTVLAPWLLGQLEPLLEDGARRDLSKVAIYPQIVFMCKR